MINEVHRNKFHLDLKNNVLSVLKVNTKLKFLSVGLSAIGAIGMCYASIANNSFLPMKNICFKPDSNVLQQPFKDEQGKHSRFCSNGENILPILSPYYESLKENNIDFAIKVGVVNKHSDNLNSTKILLSLCVASGLLGSIAAGTTINNLRESKNAFYQLKHSEYSLNEIHANASKTLVSDNMESIFTPPEPDKPQLHPTASILQNAELETKVLEQIAKGKEQEKIAAKLEKEILKLKGAKVDSGEESTSESNEDNVISEELKERRQSMIDALKSHEKGWLWYFIDNQTPLWLIGRQGSGKTWTLASIALIRKYCLDIAVGYVIDEHGNGEDNKPIWELLEPIEICSKPEKIRDAFQNIATSYMTRINDGKNSKSKQLQDVIDEYTTYKDDEIIGENANNWCRKHMKDSRKAYRWTVAATHNDTRATFPEGTYNQRLSSTNMLEKKSKNGKVPLSSCKVIRGFYDDEGEEILDFKGNFPTWFTPKLIHGHLTGGEEIEF